MPDPLLIMPGKDWYSPPDWPAAEWLHPENYLSGTGAAGSRGRLVINLAASYRYLSTGYYVSLLAEARSQRVIPSVRTIEELSRRTIYSLSTADLGKVASRLAAATESTTEQKLSLLSYFGYATIPGASDLCRQLFERFPTPILRIEIRRNGGWHIGRLRAVPYARLTAEQREQCLQALGRFLGRGWRRHVRRNRFRYDLAVLHDPQEVLPPSDRGAHARLIRAGRKMGFNVELITRRDYSRLAEYDALFIRETTAINHHTFAFATRAQAERMPVIDDPDSILRCTNKVYLAELLAKHRIAHPRTLIVNDDNLETAGDLLGYPVVLKVPDSSFSRGVHKAESFEELIRLGRQLLNDSELVLAQEYVYTDYDWRIGVLAGKPLFACQYFMARKHWQILDHSGERAREGGWKTWPIDATPAEIVSTALKATRLIGNGLYGVDLKALPGRTVVIEVNDNPNLEAGVEDAILGEALYRRILEEFARRIEQPR